MLPFSMDGVPMFKFLSISSSSNDRFRPMPPLTGVKASLLLLLLLLLALGGVLSSASLSPMLVILAFMLPFMLTFRLVFNRLPLALTVGPITNLLPDVDPNEKLKLPVD